MWFLLFWYLPAAIAFFFVILIMEKAFTIKDIFYCITMGLFGWLTILFLIYVVCEEFGDVRLIPFKRKK